MRGQWTLSRYTALAVLAGAVALGAAQNVVFTSSLGNSDETRAVWIGFAILAALIKLRVPLTDGWSSNKVLVATFCAALAFDVLCAFGHGAITRGAELERYQRATIERGELRLRVERLERELDALPAPSAPKESVAALTARYQGAVASSRCTGRESQAWCIKRLAPYIEAIEQARLVAATYGDADKTRDAKEREIRLVRAELDSHKLPAHPDPQAQAIVRALAGVWDISDSFAASLQTAVGMVLIELAVIAGAIMLHAPARQPAPPAPASHSPSTPRGGPGKPARPARTPDSILQAIRALASGQTTAPGVTGHGDSLSCSQTALGLALGVSQPTAARYLRELEATGLVEVERDKSRTTVTVR